MSKYLSISLCILVLAIFTACKSKKTSLSGDDPVEVTDFIDFFPERKLPFNISDTSLGRKDNDSLLISYPIFTQFVPDSVMSSIFGKNVKPKLYPLGKVSGDETYLFVKGVSGGKKGVLLVAFDKKNNYLSTLPMLPPVRKAGTQYSSSLDNRFNIYKNISRKNSDGSLSEGRDVFVLNAEAKKFMLIMTDAPGDEVPELINPIDTLSRKQKYTGDYGSGKSNIFSFRDAKRSDRIQFFIHFEKNNGDCTGELKGEAIMRTANKAEYQVAGEPCALQFTFSASSVTVKETAACGSRRGLRCSFDGVYPKKKEAKAKDAKTKKSTSK